MTEPAVSVSSIVGEISLQAITDCDQTFITWHTEYSNDVDADFMGDARWKKREMFAEMKRQHAAPAQGMIGSFDPTNDAPGVATHSHKLKG